MRASFKAILPGMFTQNVRFRNSVRISTIWSISEVHKQRVYWSRFIGNLLDCEKTLQNGDFSAVTRRIYRKTRQNTWNFWDGSQNQLFRGASSSVKPLKNSASNRSSFLDIFRYKLFYSTPSGRKVTGVKKNWDFFSGCEHPRQGSFKWASSNLYLDLCRGEKSSGTSFWTS